MRSLNTPKNLYTPTNQRLYLTSSERRQFIAHSRTQSPHIESFCLALLYTGCRISELRTLNAHAVVIEEQRLAVRSLKKRDKRHIREIPIPLSLAQSLGHMARKIEKNHSQINSFLWASERGEAIDRITAYRWVKSVMQEAGISGPQACPKGLRHSFGIHAIRSGVPLNMLQKWMGHADIRTTAIYTNAVGPEEIEIAKRMW